MFVVKRQLPSAHCFSKHNNYSPKLDKIEQIADIQDMRTVNQTSTQPAVKARFSHDLWLALLLVATVFVAFHSLAGNEFVNVDDHVYVTNNPHVKGGLSLDNVIWAFTTFEAEFWHPLTWLSLMIDAHLYGLNAGGFLFTNLLLHLTATLFLFAALTRMTGNRWASGISALVFAAHPLHVESVAWVAERKDVLSGALGCITLWAYSQYVKAPSMRRLTGVAMAFGCGLMAKSMVITLPAVMLLLDIWPLKRWHPIQNRRPLPGLLMEKMPLFGLAVLFAIITLLAQSASFGLATLDEAPMSLRLQNALVSYVRYLWHFVWPLNLALWYPYPTSVPFWQWGSALGVLTAISAGCLAGFRRWPFLLIGWLWYLGMLFPVIGFVKFGGVAMADRFTYLPLIGITIMLCWGIDTGILKRLGPKSQLAKGLLCTAFATALVPLTIQQTSHWRNSLALYAHAVNVNPQSHMAHYTYGWALGNAGQYRAALEHLKQAVALAPQNADMHYHLGKAYMLLKHPVGARREFQTALTLHPAHKQAREDLQKIEDIE